MNAYCNGRYVDPRWPHTCLCVHLAHHDGDCECACGHTWVLQARPIPVTTGGAA